MIVDLDGARRALTSGGVVGLPTDTVYGIGCDPAGVEAGAAVERIYAIKGRPAELELGLLAADLRQVASVARLGLTALRLGRDYWPGALSLIVPVREEVRLAVPRRGTTVSVRIPDHPLLRELLSATGPLATTSANRHGRPPCVTAADVDGELGADLDGVLDGGPAAGQASTIIDLTQAPPRVLRTGLLTAEQLRTHLGG